MIQLLSINSKTKTRLALFIAVTFGLLVFTGCRLSSESLEFERAEKAADKNKPEKALSHYKAIVDKYVQTPMAIKAAKGAAKIQHYDLKRPKEAVAFYKHVVLYATDSKDRVEAQKKLAEIYLTETLDYTQAIAEYSRLLELSHTPQEDFHYRISIARAYFYLSNFYQAQVEVENILKGNHDRELLFDAFLLKANIFLTAKKLDEAVIVLKQLIDQYPERSRNETIGLVLAVTYEEQKNFAKAIETLESIKDTYPRKEFIEQRIKILRERQSHLPGARGFRK